VANIGLYAAKYRAGFVSFIIFVMFGAIVGMVYAGMSEVAKDNLSMGKLIEFFFLTIFIGSSLAGLSESYSVLQKTIGASERINEILNEPSEVNVEDENLKATVRGNVKFDQVDFAYPSRQDMPLFSGLSLKLKLVKKSLWLGQVVRENLQSLNC
jgi:ATP-binding cassette subfamily B protein